MFTHTDLLDSLASNLEDDNAFLVYADLVQELYGEDSASKIRDVVRRTSEAIHSEDGRAKERASDSRHRIIHLGRARAARDAMLRRRELANERTAAILSKPTNSDLPR